MKTTEKKDTEKSEKKSEKIAGTAQIVCNDKKCPVHGSLSVRGRSFVGKVISDRMSKTVTVSWETRVYVPKYERYEIKYSKVKAHVPDHLIIKKDDQVKISECRPLSKTVTFVVMEKIGE